MDIAALIIAILALIVSGLAFWANHRSAKAAEDTLDLQRQAAEPKVKLEIKRYAPITYALRNVGEATARNLALVDEDAGYASWEQPLGDLQGGDMRPFVLAVGSPPARLRFTWDGQDEPVPVELRG